MERCNRKKKEIKQLTWISLVCDLLYMSGLLIMGTGIVMGKAWAFWTGLIGFNLFLFVMYCLKLRTIYLEGQIENDAQEERKSETEHQKNIRIYKGERFEKRKRLDSDMTLSACQLCDIFCRSQEYQDHFCRNCIDGIGMRGYWVKKEE